MFTPLKNPTMKTWQTLSVTALTATLIPLIAGNAHAANFTTVNTIDPFTTSQSETGNSGDFVFLSSTESISGSFLGGGTDRTFGYEFLSGTGTSTVTTGSGSFQILNGAGIGSNTNITYNGFSSPNLSSGGADRFLFTVNNATVGGTITLTLGGGSLSSAEAFSVSYAATGTPIHLGILFSEFGPSLSGLTDFVVDIESTGTVSFGPIVTAREGVTPPPVGTPEPATVLGLLAVGILGTMLKQTKA
jgi:hypothetical protein